MPNNLDVLQPYFAARATGQRNRLSLVQNQLAQKQQLDSRLRLAQLQDELERRQKEEQRQARTTDPYYLSQITENEAQTALANRRLAEPIMTPAEKLADYGERLKLQHQYDRPVGAGRPFRPNQFEVGIYAASDPSWIIADKNLKRLEYLSELDLTKYPLLETEQKRLAGEYPYWLQMKANVERGIIEQNFNRGATRPEFDDLDLYSDEDLNEAAY